MSFQLIETTKRLIISQPRARLAGKTVWHETSPRCSHTSRLSSTSSLNLGFSLQSTGNLNHTPISTAKREDQRLLSTSLPTRPKEKGTKEALHYHSRYLVTTLPRRGLGWVLLPLALLLRYSARSPPASSSWGSVATLTSLLCAYKHNCVAIPM